MTPARMVRTATATVASLVLLGGCSTATDPDVGGPSPGVSGPSPTGASPTAGPVADLPEVRSLTDVGAKTISATPFPDFALAVGRVVWVSGVGDGLVGYDGATGRPLAETKVSDVVAAMDTLEQTLWLVETRFGVSRTVGVDGRTGEVRTRVKLPWTVAQESSVAAGREGVFALLTDGRIAAVDPEDNAVRTFRGPVGATALRYGFGSLWVPTAAGTVHRVDPVTGRTKARVAVGSMPRFVTVGHGGVWVMNQEDGTVSRIDPRSDTADPPVVVQAGPIEGGDIASGPDGVWVRAGTAAASLLDPDTGEVTERVGGDVGSGSVVETAGNLWITAHDHRAIYRVPWPPAG